MQLARVRGTVVATTISEGLRGVKLLMIQPLTHDLAPDGVMVVACDTAQAGEGDLVYFVKSREASQALDPTDVPVDATIVGIVDAV
jgi:ethanolamine utilization protein EutN